jgi:hypothetical protein
VFEVVWFSRTTLSDVKGVEEDWPIFEKMVVKWLVVLDARSMGEGGRERVFRVGRCVYGKFG